MFYEAPPYILIIASNLILLLLTFIKIKEAQKVVDASLNKGDNVEANRLVEYKKRYEL